MSCVDDSEDLLGGDVLNINIPNEDESVEPVENEGNENSDSKIVEPPKKRTIRNLQPRLNPQRLSGTRGVHTIETYFEDFKFRGKGHEATDLNRIMKKLEHWAHRLFPKYRFDDCLENIEKLGNKRTVQNYMNQYRHGTLQLTTNPNEEEPVESMDPEDDLAQPLDELDSYLGQQIAIAKAAQTFNQTANNDDTFNALIATPSSRIVDSPMTSSTPFISKRISTSTSVQKSTPTFTEEQKERMALNRKLALERLLQKKKEMEAFVIIPDNNITAPNIPTNESEDMVTEDEMLEMLNKETTVYI